MSGKKSKSKGARGERELAKELEKLGIKASRGRQYSGGPDSPDVVTSIDDVHFECKRVERLLLYPSLHQSARDSGDKIPVVAHRKNREDWVIIIYLKDLLEFCHAVNGDPR